MTEELAYSSSIVITMPMNTKSWIFQLTQRVGSESENIFFDSNTKLISRKYKSKKDSVVVHFCLLLQINDIKWV